MFSAGYREFVRTMGPGHQPISLANAALGVCGEVNELIDEIHSGEDPLSELGDVVFYLAALADAMSLSDAFIMHYRSASKAGYLTFTEPLYHHACCLAELSKKALFHGSHNFSVVPFAEHIAKLLDTVEALGAWSGHTLECIQRANVQKLRTRWPQGFGNV